jgi:ATP-dependent Lon protease
MNEMIINKIINLQEIIINVIRSNQLYKTMGFLEINDLNACVIFAESIYAKLKGLLTAIGNNNTDADENQIINTLQAIISEISTLISLYGCDTIESLIQVCIGKYAIDDKYAAKYKLLNNYVSPLRYRTLDWKKNKKIKSEDESIIKTADNFECFDIDSGNINFQNRIYGIKIALHNVEKQQTIIVYGVIEDMILDFIDDNGIKNRINDLIENKPTENSLYENKSYERFIHCLTLKDILIYSNTTLKRTYINYVEDYINTISKKPLLQIINEFTEQEIFDKRNTLITLLINSGDNDCHYLAYLLYDLLSNDIRGMIDTYEQTIIYDCLPFYVKKYFREAMKHIITYTNKLTKIDISKISLEQRICLMKTEDNVKEKAMAKLKEVKLKSEDTGSKAMQYLDGLLKIPFGIYKEEQILHLMTDIISLFTSIVTTLNTSHIHITSQLVLPFPVKLTYTGVEIYKHITLFKNVYKPQLDAYLINCFKTLLACMQKKTIITIYDDIKSILNKYVPSINVSIANVSTSGKTIVQLRSHLNTILEDLIKIDLIKECIFNNIIYKHSNCKDNNTLLTVINNDVKAIENKINTINLFMKTVAKTLDDSVYGHCKAKRQIERIIGQWISGELTGYCFGFEGPPGVGKTSLAKKGISNCLKDDQGVSRPFSFIAMGGSTNSSTLDGHNYTYVGSTWGRIVDILMDTKIMNPIIFIDELDKVSKTDNGKEIIGILMHLIDQTQNDAFQDKYFNGINLNLSKALFIFSYNDPESIDRILLDRIHRIKFEHLTLEDKLVIMHQFILPEVYQKMGLADMIEISNETIEYIIDNYTAEPGVRKLKEIVFEIFGEINLLFLKNDGLSYKMSLPIVITIDDIKNKYLKERHEIKAMKIHSMPSIGVINGLWANSLGKGGVLPIETSFFPSGSFLDLKLTGMQGDVMKESMAVAKSLAWSLFLQKEPNKAEELQKSKNQGLHIHVPEGATPKDGPSAGAAITMVLYSLFNGLRIKNDIAMTGEICLQGRITAIGGLDLKILGGIRAGVKTFIYPYENEKDFNDFMEKYGKKKELNNIQFISVNKIEEVIPLIFHI